MASVTGPHSTGSVSTCMARGSEVSSCSGRVIRSHQRETGRKQSVTPMVASLKSSICCSTGSGPRLANTSPGRSRTGRRLTCATPAAVSMFIAARPDRGRAGHHLAAVLGLGVGHRRQRHALLVVGADRSAGSRAPDRAPRRYRPRCRGRRSPSSRRTAAAPRRPATVRCAARNRTSACAAVRRTVFMPFASRPIGRSADAARSAKASSGLSRDRRRASPIEQFFRSVAREK